MQNKNSDFCAPLTSFDWNEVDANLIGTSSIDTTCTIWGLETSQVINSSFVFLSALLTTSLFVVFIICFIRKLIYFLNARKQIKFV